jgi:hypothetical protein
MGTKVEREILEAVNRAEEEQEKYPLEEGRALDYIAIFALAKKFATPFTKTQAYKLGIIDDKGNILRPPKTRKEKDAFTPLDNIVLRIKKLIPKNLWYLLTFAYIFKGFVNQKTYKSLYEGVETEAELLQIEEKKLALQRAKCEVEDTIRNNPNFNEDELWSFVAEKDI